MHMLSQCKRPKFLYRAESVASTTLKQRMLKLKVLMNSCKLVNLIHIVTRSTQLFNTCIKSSTTVYLLVFVSCQQRVKSSLSRTMNFN